MSLILKQESEGSVPTPATGKGVIYINTSGELAVKKPDGSGTAFGNITAVDLDGNVSNVLSGTGTWIAAGGGSSSSIANGTSSVTIPASDGNIRFRSNASYVANITETGANIFGYLSVSGTATLAGLVRLGPVGNIQITGGNAGYVLSTDGAGNLSWAAGGGGSYGDSNVVTLLSSYGSNTITTTGNITGGNLSSLGAINAANGRITAGLSFETGGTANISGNAIIGNITTGGAINAGSIRINEFGSGNISNVGGMYVGYLQANNGVSTTFVSATSGLSASGTVTLGTVANVKIAGGTSGYVLSTDGAGNLSWISGGGGGSANLEQVDTDILPIFDSIYDIGSNTARFYDMYLGNDLDINGATLTASTPLLGGNAVFTTTNDVVLSGALLADQLLITDNIITPDASTARQYMGDKGIVVINGDLDVDGDWFGTPVVQTTPAVIGVDAGTIANADFFGSKFNGYISDAVTQSDGKLVVTGGFTQYEILALKYIARINTDGNLDTDFQFNSVIGGGINDTATCLALQTNGKIVVAGAFSSVDGSARFNIARLNADGTFDSSFNTNTSSGMNGTPTVVKVQSADGKILVGGSFSTYDGFNRFRLMRFDGAGLLDSPFTTNMNAGFNDSVLAMEIQSDGKILVGGSFTTFDGNTTRCLVRLNSNGTRDTSFNSGGSGFTGAWIENIKIQTDGKIIVTGFFQSYNGTNCGSICRLNSDGTLDTTFDANPGITNLGNPAVVNGSVTQADGKIIFAGTFNDYNGTTIYDVVRVETDGSIDTTFVSPVGITGGYATALTLTSTEDLVLTGNFTSFDGVTQQYGTLINTVYVAAVAAVTPPTGGEEGFIRYNQDITAFQAYNGTSWELLERVTSAPTTLATTGTVDIDFTGSTLNTQGSLTGNITYTGSNYLTGSSVTTRIVNGATERTVTFPTGWVFVGTEPTAIAAGKTAILTVTSFGTTEADCVAAWAVSA